MATIAIGSKNISYMCDPCHALYVEMIHYLQNNKPDDASNKMRRKIISVTYEMHWAKAGDWKGAVAAINTFCAGPHGIFKKELNKHTYIELVRVVTQFESMYKKYLKAF